MIFRNMLIMQQMSDFFHEDKNLLSEPSLE
jgi:hypothetical protein